MKSTKEKIAVMQAWVDGLEIEYCIVGTWSNYEVIANPSWDWAGCDYRVKQKTTKLYYINFVEDFSKLPSDVTKPTHLDICTLKNSNKTDLQDTMKQIVSCKDFVRLFKMIYKK